MTVLASGAFESKQNINVSHRHNRNYEWMMFIHCIPHAFALVEMSTMTSMENFYAITL